jgi:hypothetical protein
MKNLLLAVFVVFTSLLSNGQTYTVNETPFSKSYLLQHENGKYPSDQASQIHVVGWCNFAQAKLWSN